MSEVRKLAAILAADVVGYSRLTGIDEDRTLARLRALRSDLIDPTIAVHRGRVVKRTGDGAIVEFRSVVDAVRCAIEVQNAMVERNAGVAPDKRIEFRIGIHLGDVVEEADGDLMGDGVNIAARLEGVAAPGAICLSEDAYRQVKARLDLQVSDLGATALKNIADPMRVYSLQVGAPAQAKPASSVEAKVEDRSPAHRASSVIPSIAILPFVNMSGDPEQEFFADGLTEDIITELSRFRQLLVISRNAVFVHKGKPVKAQQIAREFGVDYVVEGSVRKAADRVRVTVQLIDGETETHLWAERYDRKLEDIFAIQDEVTSSIVATLFGRVEAARHDRVRRKPAENLAAYEHLLAGKVLHHRSNREANGEALRALSRAVELDPNYAHAHAWKACVIGQAVTYGWCEDLETSLEIVKLELQTALSLDDNDPDVHRILAALHLIFNEHDKAAYHQERALGLNPNSDLIVVQQGELLTWLGRPEEGIEWIRRAMRLNPYHPDRFWSHLGRAQYSARAYPDAVTSFSKLTTPEAAHQAYLAAASAQLGDHTAAVAHAQETMRREPDFKTETFLSTLHYRRPSDVEHLREGLIRAGLPG